MDWINTWIRLLIFWHIYGKQHTNIQTNMHAKQYERNSKTNIMITSILQLPSTTQWKLLVWWKKKEKNYKIIQAKKINISKWLFDTIWEYELFSIFRYINGCCCCCFQKKHSNQFEFIVDKFQYYDNLWHHNNNKKHKTWINDIVNSTLIDLTESPIERLWKCTFSNYFLGINWLFHQFQDYIQLEYLAECRKIH